VLSVLQLAMIVVLSLLRLPLTIGGDDGSGGVLGIEIGVGDCSVGTSKLDGESKTMSAVGLRTVRNTGTAVMNTGHTGEIQTKTGRASNWAIPNGSGRVQNGYQRPSTAVFLLTKTFIGFY
jgi:hypothetical protein